MIPFDQIAAAALGQSERLLRDWYPAGRVVGREFLIGNLRGDRGDSLSINLTTGLWKDFAADHGGHDLIDLQAARRGTDRIAAARELSEMLGINGHHNGHAPTGNEKNGRPLKADWRPMLPPSGTQRPDAMLAGFDVVHEYTNAEDRVTHYVGRTEARNGRRKQFTPVTYGILDGKEGWHNKHPKAPRPLYGLNRLSTMPEAPVLLCEGE